MTKDKKGFLQKIQSAQTTLNDLKVATFLAIKQVTRSNKWSLFLTISIMSLVFLNIAFIAALMSGMVETMNSQAIDTQFSHIKIEPPENEMFIKNVKSLKNKINHLNGVIGSTAHYKTYTQFTYDKRKDGQDTKIGSWIVSSMSPEEEKKVSIFHNSILAGEYLNKNDRDKILLGKDISGGYTSNFIHESLGGASGLKIGEKITITYPNGIKREYTIKGIFDTKNLFADAGAFVTEKEMEDMLQVSNQATEILVKTKNINNTAKYIQDFRSIGITKEKINPWTEYTGIITDITESMLMIKILLTGIGLFVSGITIFIIIFIGVINKRKEIGILKAIGMEKHTIVISYLLQALFYALLGIGGGLFILYFILSPYFAIHPLDFPIGLVYLEILTKDVIINSIALIVASIISGFIPAWGVSKKSILDLIWGV